MRNILKVNVPGDYSMYHGLAPLHPLVTVIDFDAISPIHHTLNDYGVYGLFIHRNLSIDLTYGCGTYDYVNDTLICVAPGQIGGKEDNGDTIDIDGWALLFHPDLLHGTPLESRIKEYTFFDYHVNEALHTTDEEYETIGCLMHLIKEELHNPPDSLQRNIVVNYIHALLDYCQRFYNRQFNTRKTENNNILSRFESLVHEYYDKGEQLTSGIPTIQYCADKMCMSPNYLGDVLKRATGHTPGNYIRQFIVREAKNHLSSGKSVSEVAYSLGFDYPQHFSRMFKNITGMTPTQYRDNKRAADDRL